MRHEPRPYPSAVSSVPPVVRSGSPKICGGRVFSCPDMPRVSFREIDGFTVVLPPRVKLRVVAEHPLTKPPSSKSGAPQNHLPPVTSHPTSPSAQSPLASPPLPSHHVESPACVASCHVTAMYHCDRTCHVTIRT